MRWARGQRRTATGHSVAQWYRARTESPKGARKTTMIVALARNCSSRCGAWLRPEKSRLASLCGRRPESSATETGSGGGRAWRGSPVTVRGGGDPNRNLGFYYGVWRVGPPPGSLAVEPIGCFMVPDRTRIQPNTRSRRHALRLNSGLPSDCRRFLRATPTAKESSPHHLSLPPCS